MTINTHNLSFWESESFLSYDVIIVGAGISGLSTAISLVEKNKEIHVLVLEKSLFPSGASTKNAGFACFGSLSELCSDIEIMGEQKCVDLVQKRWSGLQKLRSRFSDKELGYEALGGYELFKPDQLNYLMHLEEINALLKPTFHTDVFTDVSAQIKAKGFRTETFSKMVFNSFEGQIDTGKTMSSLWRRANELGVKILTGADVTHIDGNSVGVKSATSIVTFHGEKVVVTTNAFTKELFPELALKPGRGQVMMTHPIPELKCKGTFHIEEGYYYFRNVGNRLLLGGGRNLDFRGEETLNQGINPKIDKELRRILGEEILPGLSFEIAQQWTGIMAFGDDKNPILEWTDTCVLLAVRLGGMGMAIGTELGDVASDMVLSTLEVN